MDINKLKLKLKFLFERSNNSYLNYLKDKNYINALLIKDTNELITNILKNHGYLFQKNKEINNILNHFNVWFFQFENLENKKNFDLNDEFIFKDIKESIKYPTNEINNILK